MNIYNHQLDKNAANHLPLTPLSFLRRTALVFPDHPSLIYNYTRYTWAETYARCVRLAHALQKRGITTGHTVSIIAPNIPAHFEVYFGVPMAGSVINPLNTRLDAPSLAHMLAHSETKLLMVDRQYSALITSALKLMAPHTRPILIGIEDESFTEGELLGDKTYEELLQEGDPDFDWPWPSDEWNAISLNYTSGTTGNPKGVVYHHRGAYLNALGNVLAFNAMPAHPIYLWTLPMFHASGWCFPWSITAHAGTHICLRKVEPARIFELLQQHHVTHFTAAPVVLNMLIQAQDEMPTLSHTIEVMTAGSAPPAPVLAATANMGFNVTHVYGGTEVFGPNMSCAWHEEWNALPAAEQAQMKSRQGVPYVSLEHMMVADPHTLQEHPWDGKTIGEVMMRGNVVMKGYLKNPAANEAIFKGGWYHTGDLAVRHPDGYIEVKDRLKDIIISGAENICSIEVEAVLYQHPAVLEAAVVAKPHDHWGEVVCAFVELKNGATATEAEFIAFCRNHLAHFKCPKHVVLGALDKTPTGKIQKYILRERAKAL